MYALKYKLSYIFIILSLFFFSSCNDSSISNDSTGYLIVKVTDGPFPIDLIDSANVIIDRIEIRKANEIDDNPYITISEDTLIYNLVDLQNGVTSDLPEIEIPVGSYDLVRFYIAEASVVLNDGQKFNLVVPSGMQTGIKLFIDPAIDVAGGLTSELIIDFDLDRSFKIQGNPDTPAGIKGFHFSPVIRAVNNSTAGRLAGTVTDKSLNALEGVRVWVEQQDSVIASGFTENGNYSLIGLPAGVYSAFAEKAGYDKLSLDNIIIVPGNQTTQDFALKESKSVIEF